MPAEFLFDPASHQEAIDFLKSKPLVSRAVFDQLLPELRARAFVITGVENANVLQAVRDRLADLPAGVPWDKIKADIADQLHPYLASPDEPENRIAAERRAELLLRTHGFQAYATAAHEVSERQADVFPFLQYVSMEDDRVRPTHAALDGVVLPRGHEFWHSHTPPWDWGCRCQAIPMSADDVEDIEKADAHKPADNRRVLNEAAQNELTVSRRLPRNGVTYNLTAPSEQGKPGAFQWHPGNLRLPLEELKARYSPQTWAEFVTWAKIQPIEKGEPQTVWEWMNGAPAAPGPKPAPTPSIKHTPPAPTPAPVPAGPEPFSAMIAKIQAAIAKGRADLAKADADLKVAGWDFFKWNAALKAKRDAEDAAVEMVHKVIELPFSQRSPVDLQKTKNDAEHTKGIAFVRRITSHTVFGGQQVGVKLKRARAAADPAGAFIDGKNMIARTVAHELGHIVEARDAKVLGKSVAFLDKRTPGEKAKWLGKPYKSHEIAKDDQWVARGGSRYMGKIYLNGLGKHYATEILSMGIERLYVDPVGFFEKDPEYFEYVVNTLRGL